MLDGNTGTWVLSGGTIVGGSIEPGLAGAELRYGGNSTLNGVTVNTDMNMSENYSLTVTLVNGLTLNGTATMGAAGNYGRFVVNNAMTIDGTGEIVLGNASTVNGINFNSSGVLTIESGLAIHGGRGTVGTNVGGRGLVLRAPVTAEVSGQEITIYGDSLLIEAPVTAVNGGNLQLDGPMAVRAKASVAGGGTLQLGGGFVNEDTLFAGVGSTLDVNNGWHNAGAIRSDSATVQLGGTFTWPDVGDFVRSGGTVIVDGTLDNTGNGLVLDGNTGTWVLSGGTIVGGSIEPGLAGAELRYGGNSTLNGVTVNTDMNMSENYSLTVTLVNGLTLNGTATMGAAGSYGRFLVNNDMTIDGTGEIVLGNASTVSGITPNSNVDMTIESGITIHGGRGTIGANVSGRTVTNRGTVRADSAGIALTLSGFLVDQRGRGRSQGRASSTTTRRSSAPASSGSTAPAPGLARAA